VCQKSRINSGFFVVLKVVPCIPLPLETEIRACCPRGGHAFGQTYSQWAASWWQWALSIPADISPLNDPTGANAAPGQSGHVWFLAGILGGSGGAATRSVAVPAGKALFFPILNYTWVNMPELGANPWSPEQEAFARDLIAGVSVGSCRPAGHSFSCLLTDVISPMATR